MPNQEDEEDSTAANAPVKKGCHSAERLPFMSCVRLGHSPSKRVSLSTLVFSFKGRSIHDEESSDFRGGMPMSNGLSSVDLGATPAGAEQQQQLAQHSVPDLDLALVPCANLALQGKRICMLR